MTKSIDEAVARLMELVDDCCSLHSDTQFVEAALRTELSTPPVHGEPVAWRQTGKYISDWRDFSETKDSHDFWLASENKEIEFAYTTPQPAIAQPMSGRAAYQGMREALLHWQGRALEAEASNKQLVRALREEVEGPTFMGEPVIQPAPPLQDQREADAKAIYEGRHSLPGYGPWQDGGNSLIRDEARKLARLATVPTKQGGNKP